jgi:hypothetical protein
MSAGSRQGDWIPRANLQVVCYTSIVGDAVREVGKDALRLVLLVERTTTPAPAKIIKPIGKGEHRINRTGTIDAIVDRVIKQWDQLIAAGDEMTQHRCRDCGEPTAISKQGKRFCAALCFAGGGS